MSNRTYIDDNFGHWEINGPDDVEFYHQTQRTNVEKRCEGCGEMVRIQPHYAYCNECATRREQGWDF